ncbi:MAG: DMT family transporter [Desulfuromonadaceae bacterium]
MSYSAFTLIAFSGIMHALYNLYIKQSRNKTVFIWWMFSCSTGLFTALMPFLPGPFPRPGTDVILLAAAGAFCFVLYHLFTGRAYQSGDLSLSYPLTQTSMVYVPLWGGLLLGEQLSKIGLWGILIVFTGGYLLQMRRVSMQEMLRPFGSLVEPSVQAALAAGFVYSLGAIVDKIGVTSYPPLYFTYLLVVSMLALMTINILRPRHRSQIIREWRDNRRLILTGGPLMMASFISFRYGLALSPMSYAVPVRQASVVAGVLIGALILGESCGRIRFAASLMILAGICLIRFG